jgi:YD repeat-containing protein
MVGDISYDDYIQWIYNNGSEATATLKRYNETTGEYDVVESFLVHPLDSIGDIYYGQSVGWDGWMNQDRAIALTEGSYKLEVDLWGWFLSGLIQVFSDFPYKKEPGIYNAGGIRIKKIQFISGTDSQSSFVKTYEYRSDALSSGVLESPFAEYTNSFSMLPGTGGLLNTCNYINFSAQALIPLGNAPGGVIGYSKVTEKREDNSKTVYHFTTGMDDPMGFGDQYSAYRTRIIEDNSWKRGLGKQTDIYNNNNQLVRQDFSDHSFPYGTLGESSVSIIFEDISPLVAGRSFLYLQYTPIYFSKLDRHVLKTKDSTIEYSSAGNIINVTNYEYSINPYTHLKKQFNKNSKGEYLVTNFKYPLDYSVGSSPSDGTAISIKNLQDKHVISPVIEKYTEKKDANGNNTRVVSGQYVKYKSSVALPDSVFNLEVSSGLSSYQAATITGNSSNKDSHYKPSILFDSYDAYGGVTQQSKNANVKEVFLWGYKHQYIVAKVIGSTLNTVLSYVDANILDNPSSESDILTELNKIRTALTGPSVQVYTYAYKPLVGMTASVDPQGRKTSYAYDSAGRLWLIRDQDGNIIKKICYNYSGQPEDCK